MKAVMQSIRDAFADVQRPEKTMSDAEVADDWGDEASRFEEHDVRWWEIPDELIAHYSAVFCFLPPEAKLYYLPAYMSWFLRGGYQAESNSRNHLIYFLLDPLRFGPVWELMSPVQRRAVRRFAETCPDLAHDEFDRKEYEQLVRTVKNLPSQASDASSKPAPSRSPRRAPGSH